jgi:hypothetical protein
MPMMKMIDHSSAGTLTFVRTIEMCVGSDLPPYPTNSQ